MSDPTLKSLPMLETLVGFDTTSRLSNLALIEWVRDYLQGFGIDSRLTYDDAGRKANLFATLGDASQGGGIVLSGHTDVVPVEDQEWSTDPFRLTRKEDRVYGRGTTDMKGFLACVLALVPEFVARGLATPVHLALSYDEEVGCLGVRRLLAQLTEDGLRPQACIVGEPTGMEVITAHKGKLSIRGLVRGFECHSSLAPYGANAVEAAAEAVAYLKSMARRLRDQGPYNTDFDPAYTTIHTGVIQGGTVLNIVPGHCRFDFEFRYLPGEDPHTYLRELQEYCARVIEPEMTAITPEAGFHWEEIAAFPGLNTPDDDAIVTLAKGLAGSNHAGKVSYGTEAGLFQGAGIPTIICGPGHIDQAHKPDEFLAISELAACESFLRRLMDRVCRR